MSKGGVGRGGAVRVFHTMENFSGFFPHHGKLFGTFSTAWKTFQDFFHSMENFFGNFFGKTVT